MQMQNVKTLENKFIDDLIKNQSLVSVFLKNSIRLRGHLIGNDESCVFLKEKQVQLIYKHKISTICPEFSFEKFE